MDSAVKWKSLWKQIEVMRSSEQPSPVQVMIDDRSGECGEFNLLKPNDVYICRNAALNSRRYILNIYSTNIHTKYFKNAA